ncbi:S-adenosyl-L-methionine-dependent methyltransferase [Parachaetomium inaequale]|uniref:tRNA wybutosine-synthesizing protein 2 n=1 Tax=Parachaetomium inaequale TaxID=2588326 RepID=A0AAN6SSC4_9PEZI|nr:S-adenosyl-L-methionine-dependent methyltransferase [Parachaetomium inaequale]
MARPPKQKRNPIQTAVSAWLDSLPPPVLDSLADELNPTQDPAKRPANAAADADTSANDAKQVLLSGAPKRWVVYEPMVLLPSGSFAAQPWPALLSSLDFFQKEPLWTAILGRISPANKPPLTHLAINEGIPLHLSSHTEGETSEGLKEEEEEEENLLRSPSHLHPLHGDFGPPSSSSTTSPPSQKDFDSALWVSTKQNGLVQTWAPRHTMFSRGNVKEKARLLAFHSSPSRSASASASASQQPALLNDDNTSQSKSKSQSPTRNERTTTASLKGKYAVDLYAGIGYFALALARLGLRVLCWELNPWSVEGLRRGAEANGFGVKIITTTLPSHSHSRSTTPAGGGEEGDGGVDMAEILNGEGGAQIVVFLEDNRHAAGRIREFRNGGGEMEVVHVNCGFLPSSEPVWRDAWGMVAGTEGWLHLHENVGVGDIEARRGAVQGLFDGWRKEEQEEGGQKKEGRVEHVELVKTYAPGVWHCVFDVFITRSSAGE